MQMSEVVRWRIRHVGGTGDDLSTPPSSSSSSSAAVRETSLVCRVGALRSGFCGSPSLRSLSDATLMRYVAPFCMLSNFYYICYVTLRASRVVMDPHMHLHFFIRNGDPGSKPSSYC